MDSNNVPPPPPPPPKHRPHPRERLAAAELVVRLLGGMAALIAALIGLYIAWPTLHNRPKPPATPTPTATSSRTDTPRPTTPGSTAGPTTDPPAHGPNGSQPNNPNEGPAAPTTPPTRLHTATFRQFALTVEPGIAYDLEDLSNFGWSGDDAGYANRDLYRTSATSGNNRLQGVQVPVTSQASKDMNAVAVTASGSSPSACTTKSTAGGGFVSLDSAGTGTTFCVHTRGGHWALVVITRMADRSHPIEVRVSMPT